MKSKKQKSFDCIEFKRKAQEEIYEEIKEMSWEEEVAYFQREAEKGPLGEWWKKVKAAQEQRKRKAG